MGGPHESVSNVLASSEIASQLLSQRTVLVWISDWEPVEHWLEEQAITSVAALREAMARDADFLEKVPLTRFLSASPRALELVGIPDIELLNSAISDVMDGHRVDRLEAYLSGASALHESEGIVCTPAGQRRVLFTWLFSPRFRGPQHSLCIGFDITERTLIGEALAESEARYRSVVEDQTELIVRYGPGGVRTFVNDAYCRYFGATREELVGTSFFDLVAPEHRDEIIAKLGRITPETPVLRDSHRVIAPGGGVEWQEWVDRGIFDETGQLVEYQAVGRDITQQVLAQEQLREALDEVEVLQKRLAAENHYLRSRVRSLEGSQELLGGSAPLSALREEIARVAPTDATVLVRGETGVGKELIVNSLHAQSRRADRALIKINCAAIAAELVESELFGHVRGAFTSAASDREGAFVAADGGTLFLDEIGDLPLAAQAKFLRALQEGEVQPVGSSSPRRVDVRIVAATNKNLEHAVVDGAFRRDRYYRIAVFPIDVPPLRDRGADVLTLAEAFASRTAARYGLPRPKLDESARDTLMAHDWPGNVRELANVIERAVITSGGQSITSDTLSIVTLPGEEPRQGAERAEKPRSRARKTLDDAMRDHILDVLEATRWQVGGPKGAAATLDLNESTLRARMRKLGIDRPK